MSELPNTIDASVITQKESRLTERGSFGLITIFFGILMMVVLTNTGRILILLLPSFILLIVAREIMDKPILKPEIKINRIISRHRIVEGADIDITLIIKNDSRRKSHILEIRDPLLPEIEIIEGSNLFIISLEPYEETSLSYTIRIHNVGIYAFDSVHFRHRDFLGLRVEEFILLDSLSPGLKQHVSVIPRLEKIEELPMIRSQWMKLYGGYFRSKEIGHDSDFRGIRDFQFGDVLNRVNWKASARTQRLLSNEYNWDKAIFSEVILDTTRSTSPVWIQSLRAAISLSEFLLRARNSVGFTILSEFPEHLDSRVGKRQLLQITNKLLNTFPNEIPDPDIFTRRLLSVTRRFDQKSVIIIISPFIYSPIINYVISLRKRNFNVLAIIPMSLEIQITDIVKNRDYVADAPILHEMTKTQLLIERKKIRNRLKTYDIPFIEWNTQQHFGNYLRHVRRT